jgi:hypothetical protein
MGVSVSVGKDADTAVTERLIDVSIGSLGGKFGSGSDVSGLHALSRNIAAIMLNNGKKYFLIRMVASIE